MEQRNNETKKLDEIHRNSPEIRTKFIRISYEFHNASIFTHIHSREIRTKFVRISYEFHVNFVEFAHKQSKHTSKHTLQSHGHVMDHAPAFEHLGDRHAGAVFARCHSVVGRNRGSNARHGEVDLRLRIDVVPLADLDLVHAPHEEEHALLADLDDGQVGGWGRPGEEGGVEGGGVGPAGTASGGSAKRARAAPPSHNPSLPTAPFPTHNTWSTLGKSHLDKSHQRPRPPWGGVGSRCMVLG